MSYKRVPMSAKEKNYDTIPYNDMLSDTAKGKCEVTAKMLTDLLDTSNYWLIDLGADIEIEVPRTVQEDMIADLAYGLEYENAVVTVLRNKRSIYVTSSIRIDGDAYAREKEWEDAQARGEFTDPFEV